MERVHVELPGVPEGLTVYVTAYLPKADKGYKGCARGELMLAVEAFGGVAVGNPRYSWKHKDIWNLRDASAAIKELVTAYPTLKLCKNIAKIGATMVRVRRRASRRRQWGGCSGWRTSRARRGSTRATR